MHVFSFEVAIQCLEQVFEVENYDETQKESLKVDKSLQEIFDSIYDKGHIPEVQFYCIYFGLHTQYYLNFHCRLIVAFIHYRCTKQKQ